MTDTQTSSAPLRLAQYLKEFVGLRTTTVRDVAKYESVLWFGDAPQEPDLRSPAWTDGAEAGDPWLEVKKQQFEKAPAAPELVLPWLDEKALGQATPEMPILRSHILIPDQEVEVAEGETPPLAERSLGEHPEVQQAYDRYRPVWEAWSTEHRRREAIQKIYAELFSLHTQLRKQGEIFELVLGLGLMDWRPRHSGKTIPIKRHAVVAHIELQFDSITGVMRIVPPGDSARLRIEDDMLDAELRPDRSLYATMEEQLAEIGDEIWDKARMHTALKSWAGALSADSQWSPNLNLPAAADGATGLTMVFAPALILRKRAQTGMVRIYDALISQLSDPSIGVPDGWGGLIADVGDDASDDRREAENTDRADAPQKPSEIYFPLPANREQRRIVEAIERQRGVLVQGPPGTGKSHTIANLICHLLATGKRVLITAETGRALQVLKDKLPPEIQPLCVSLLGQGGDAFAELNTAVQGITTKQAAYTPGAYDNRINQIDRELDEARRQLAATDSELRSLREEETCPHAVADGAYHGTASTIAAQVAAEREKFGWLRLPHDVPVTPPVSTEGVLQWLRIRRRYTDVEIFDARKRIPASTDLPAPDEFAVAVTAERLALNELSRTAEPRAHPAYASIQAIDDDERVQLKSELHSLDRQRVSIERLGGEVRLLALQDMISGRRARWDTVTELCRALLPKIDVTLGGLQGRSVRLPDGHDPRKILADASAALTYLAKGGGWTRLGFMTPKELKGRTYLKDEVTVDGESASSVEKLQAVCDRLDLEFALAELRAAWAGVGAQTHEGDHRLQVAEIKERLSTLDRCRSYADGCHHLSQKMAAAIPPISDPDWLNGQALKWCQLIDVAVMESRCQSSTRTVGSCLQMLDAIRALHDAHPVVRELFDAIEARDISVYSQKYAHLRVIEETRADQKLRVETESVLDRYVSALVETVAESLSDVSWDERFEKWHEAWQWAVADTWLEKRADPQYQQRLWRRRHDIEKRIGSLLAEAAALRAWTHFFKRLSSKEASALKSWREVVRAMGKGTGASAKMARLRQEARQYMDACRDAIPVWVMPRYLVAEMVDPAPGRYDLVIVDEASQLGIESLFLFYIAKKMVVVGDDQQISPYGVGIADDAIAGLQRHYLSGVPNRHALSAQSSVYGNAKIRFSHNIVLREHFRCMPEIIQFSNDLCYASNGTPLDPLRAYPANRLQPLVLRHVADGHRTGSSQHAQNPAEADAIVAQIAACIQDPRYARATMGVISLQGEAQAKLIESKLLAHLEPEVIEARHLICGDAYAFQGDERNIVFLSMVAAPGDTRIGALTTESARQRFNVAVSRAQDQLWLFHSATLDMLSDACMRYRLLRYMLDPGRQAVEESSQQFDSNFERDVFRSITERGFHVRTQVSVGDPTNHRYRIDLVVEGMQGRLAVECDGDTWHGPEQYEHDMARQRDLERAGWQFVRIRGGDFYRDPPTAMESVWAELNRLAIRPGGVDAIAAQPPPPRNLGDIGSGKTAKKNVPIEQSPSSRNPINLAAPTMKNQEPAEPSPVRRHNSLRTNLSNETKNWRALSSEVLPVQQALSFEHSEQSGRAGSYAAYVTFDGQAGPDPRQAAPAKVAEGLLKVIQVEGPMLAMRAYHVYLRGCGIRRMGGDIKRSMNRALQLAVTNGTVTKIDESGAGGLLHTVVRVRGAPPVLFRERGPREFEEIPLSELQLAARTLGRNGGFDDGSDEHLRAILDFYELKRLTSQVGASLNGALGKKYPYVDEIIARGS